MQFPAYARSGDDDVFVYLARTYSYAHRTMHLAQRCAWDFEDFPEGIVNGASWYLVTGEWKLEIVEHDKSIVYFIIISSTCSQCNMKAFP